MKCEHCGKEIVKPDRYLYESTLFRITNDLRVLDNLFNIDYKLVLYDGDISVTIHTSDKYYKKGLHKKILKDD